MFGDCCIPSLMLLVGATLAHGPGAAQQPSNSQLGHSGSGQCHTGGGGGGGGDHSPRGDTSSYSAASSGDGGQRPEALPALVILLITASRLVLLPLLGVGWVLGARALGLIGPGTPRLLVLVALISNAVP